MSAQTKICARCNTIFQRARHEKDLVWDKRKYCSRECGRVRPQPLAERIAASTRIDDKSGCHLWLGTAVKRSNGLRAYIKVAGRPRIAARVVWKLHKGDIPLGLQVCHTCDNGMCINIDHFFLGTPKRNAEDMVEKGRSLRGERNPKAKLDEQAVREIRASSGSNPAIARRFGVSASTIHKIRTGQSWRHPIDDSPALLPVNPRKPGLCKKGHAMVEGNFYVLKNGRGRNCRQCALERGRARRLRASGFAA